MATYLKGMILVRSKDMKRFLIALIPALLCCAASGFAISPPPQPSSGPGSSSYSHGSVLKVHIGEGASSYWLFEPSSPRPDSAPVVIFTHGWGGTNPASYGGWIEHLVRRGSIVIYPLYQEDGNFRYPVSQFLPNTIAAIRDAFSKLDGQAHVRADRSKVAAVGHSVGGLLAANVAAVARKEGIPQPIAVMSVEPGKSWARSEKVAVPLEDLSKIPASTLLLAVAGDQDKIAKDIDAKKVFYAATSLPAANKNYVVINSDEHGSPELKASHFAPVARNEDYNARSTEPAAKPAGKGGFFRGKLRERFILRRSEQNKSSETEPSVPANFAESDALDYFGFWKLCDGLIDAAFYGRDRQYALGNTPEQRYMGKWSDGTPVRELTVLERP